MIRMVDCAVRLADGDVVVGRRRGDREFGAVNGCVDQHGKFYSHEEAVVAIRNVIETITKSREAANNKGEDYAT